MTGRRGRHGVCRVAGVALSLLLCLVLDAGRPVLVAGVQASGVQAPDVHAADDPASGRQAVQTSVIDDLGQEVVLARPPGRIVSLAPGHTETLFALGAGDRVVGVTVHGDWPPPARWLPRVGGFGEVDLEAVLSLRPDLVLAAGLQSAGAVPALRRLGVPTFVLEPTRLEEVLDGIRRVGRLVGAEEAGDGLADRLSSRLAGLRASVATASRPRVFFELSEDLFTVGPGSFLHDLIRAAGGDNIAGEAGRPYPRLSAEAVIASDPEVILLADHPAGVGIDDVKARPGWAGITAVRRGRVLEVDDVDVLNRPGPRVVDGLEFLVRALHGGS